MDESILNLTRTQAVAVRTLTFLPIALGTTKTALQYYRETYGGIGTRTGERTLIKPTEKGHIAH